MVRTRSWLRWPSPSSGWDGLRPDGYRSVATLRLECRTSRVTWHPSRNRGMNMRVLPLASMFMSAIDEPVSALPPWPPKPSESSLPNWSAKTLAVAAGRPIGPGSPLNVPLVLASNFRDGGEYSRTHGTENWIAFEQAMGLLEGGHAVSFASGMAASSGLLHALMPRVLVLPTAS